MRLATLIICLIAFTNCVHVLEDAEPHMDFLYPDTCSGGKYSMSLHEEKQPDIEYQLGTDRILGKYKYITRINSSGDTVWKYEYSPKYPLRRYFYPNGDVLLIEDYRNIVKLNSDGQKVFCVFFPPNTNTFHALENGGLIAYNSYKLEEASDSGNFNFYFLDPHGQIEKSLYLDKPFVLINDLVSLENQDIIISAEGFSNPGGDYLHRVMRVSRSGNLKWQKDFDLPIGDLTWLFDHQNYMTLITTDNSYGQAIRISFDGDSLGYYNRVFPINQILIEDVRSQGDLIYTVGTNSRRGLQGNAVVHCQNSNFEMQWIRFIGKSLWEKFTHIDFLDEKVIVCKGFSSMDDHPTHPRLYLRAVLDSEGLTCY